MADEARSPSISLGGLSFPTPLFLPVFEPGNPYLRLDEMQEDFGVRAVMVNAYFLYRQRELRRLLPERGIKDYLGFDGLVVTDSGAFQAFRRRLYLSNKRIIRFQEDIGADVISPLDVVTPPGDDIATAEGKLRVTLKRIEEGLALVERSILIGVQQGGRFLELRKRALERLAELGASYVALGGLVPFFTRNHHLSFVAHAATQARRVLPQQVPIHLYGAGDPLELPFYVARGCDVFDSSSFLHYAERGFYMTPYGALPAADSADVVASYACPCPYCEEHGEGVLRDTGLLCRHNLWTVMATVERVRALLGEGALLEHLDGVVRVHQEWFPGSLLGTSWRADERQE
ncbi:MAG: tRNA-guanine transglycosylase [Candidatus Brocadiae bacterium]|nr:tRNA-guanine transglycosylase [Candidatus Brocadiia bacterium]